MLSILLEKGFDFHQPCVIDETVSKKVQIPLIYICKCIRFKEQLDEEE